MTFFVIYFVFSLVVFPQEESYLCLSGSQIYQIIKKSNEKYNHLDNISLIYPGQSLVFELHEGLMVNKKVNPGDTQWGMVSRITENDTMYSLLISQSINEKFEQKLDKSEPLEMKVPYWSIFGIIVTIGILIYVYRYLRRYR